MRFCVTLFFGFVILHQTNYPFKMRPCVFWAYNVETCISEFYVRDTKVVASSRSGLRTLDTSRMERKPNVFPLL